MLLTQNTGSGSIEGHHNRLQNVVMPGFGSPTVDQFANKLWDEKQDYLNVMTKPHLWSEKKKKHMEAVERHMKKKRIRLANITGSRTVTHHSFYHDFHTSTTMKSSNTTTTTATTSAPPDVGMDINLQFDGNGTDSAVDHVASPDLPPPTSSLSLGPVPFPFTPFSTQMLLLSTLLHFLLQGHLLVLTSSLMRGANVANKR